MYSLPPLPYAENALEPFIDEETMKIHHGKHHQAYIDNLNKLLEGHEDLQKMHGAELMASLDKVPEEIRMKVRNNLGGVLNHNLFWQIMAPNTKYEILNTKFGKELVKTFGSMEAFQEKFAAAALGRFGSGWVWLSINSKGQLEMSDTPNQDNPIMEGKEPILGLDVWEHAYYLKYQNRRAEYIKNWWNVVNWPEVEERYVRATEQ
jgi:Fe-Mn family superoxide dismutase